MLDGDRIKRFWDKVNIGSGDECWEWQAGKHGHGYGMFYTGRKCVKTGQMEFAHRVAYEIDNGPFDYTMCVMHTCDNRACVNPNHLTLGTHYDNMQDMKVKGRASPPYKINPETAKAIRESCKSILNKELAVLFNLDDSYVSRVRRDLVPAYKLNRE